MVATDFTLLLLSLAVRVGILIFAVAKKLNDGNHRVLYATLIVTLAAGLTVAIVHIWLASS